MIYRSNLTSPPMEGFKLASPVIQNCGHDIPSDPDFDPNCGYWSHDEMAILYASFRGPLAGNTVVEIGSRFGWTAKAINAATGGCVLCVDPILKYGSPEHARFRDNLGELYGGVIALPYTSEIFFRNRALEPKITRYHGFVIDGNHEAPNPLNDCKGALAIAQQDCIIALHDGRGKPIIEAAAWLMDHGFNAQFYRTPNGVFICWRGFDGWTSPDHDPDPAIDWSNIVERVRAQLGGRLDL